MYIHTPFLMFIFHCGLSQETGYSFLCYIADILQISFSLSLFNFFKIFSFLGPHPRHMEIPRLGVESELQLPAHSTATAMWDPSCICNLHYSSRQHQILNPRSEARDRTCILMDASWIGFYGTTMGNLSNSFFFLFFFFFSFSSCTFGIWMFPCLGQIGTWPAALHHGIATPDSSRICDLHCSLWQPGILNRVRPGIKPTSSQTLGQVVNPLSRNGNSFKFLLTKGWKGCWTLSCTSEVDHHNESIRAEWSAHSPTADKWQVLDSSLGPGFPDPTQTRSAPPPCLQTRATQDAADLHLSSSPAPNLLCVLSEVTCPLWTPHPRVWESGQILKVPFKQNHYKTN